MVDVPLSHCMHAGLEDVWLVHQYRAHGLAEYLRNGRPWDLDRSHGGLLLLGPSTGEEGAGWHTGNADAIWRNRALIAEVAPRDVLVVSADHLYRMDYREVLAAHRSGGAALTMVTVEVRGDDPSRFGVVESDGDGRVTGFSYKPDAPRTRIVTTEVFAYATEPLLAALAQLAGEAGPEGLSDFGDGLVPRLVEAGEVREHRYTGYWRDLGTITSYWRAHRELLADPDLLDLDDPERPFVGGD
jgi:glucose-1-phosphate adenylyltransferase